MHIPKYLHDLMDEYKRVYNQKPRGFNYDEWNSFEEYGKYLSEEIQKTPFRIRLSHAIVNMRNKTLSYEKIYPINEQIDFYEENINILKYLLDKLDYAIKEHEYNEEKNELNHRQIGCIRRIMEAFVIEDDKKYYIKFSEAAYEIVDFIYYPNIKYDKLSRYEIEIIRMMANYLINKAINEIKLLKGDEYNQEFKLQKRRENFNRIYYKLIYKDVIIGKGWIRKRLSYIKKGLYLYIEPSYREKGYGSIFYNLLVEKMAKMDILFVILKVKKNDKRAINFLDKLINKYEKRVDIFNNKIFIDTLSVDG